MNLFESNNESSDRGRNLRATIIDSGQPQRVVRGLKVGISYRKTAICEFSALKEHNLSKSYIRTTTTLKPKSSLILAGFLEYILLGIDFKDNFQNVSVISLSSLANDLGVACAFAYYLHLDVFGGHPYCCCIHQCLHRILPAAKIAGAFTVIP